MTTSHTRAGRRGFVAAAVACLTAASSIVAGAATTAGATGRSADRAGRPTAASTMLVDDYPYRGAARGSVVDTWRFYNGYCTSFVAWRINDLAGRSDWADHKTDSSTAYWKFTNFMPKPGGGYVQFGNAETWDDAARALGWTVDTNPSVGAIAQYNGYEGDASNSSLGHVAVVTKVYSDGYVDVEEYNWSSAGKYDRRFHVAVPRYIHVPGVPVQPTQPPPNQIKPDVAVSPFGSAKDYVNWQYFDFAAATPTADELTWWRAYLNGGSNPGGLQAFLLDQDTAVADTTAPIVRLYMAYFKRAPDYDGYNLWVGQLRQGNTVPNISETFARSPEFQQTYGSLTNPAFVDLLYRNVFNRTADANGRAFWIDNLNNGWTRGRVMAAFSESPEFKNQTSIASDVARLYLHMFRRSPDAGGWAGWQNQMRAGVSLESVANSFRLSPEYRNRFGA